MRAIRSSVRPNTDRGVSRVIQDPFSSLTDEALAIFGVDVEVLAVGDHAASQVGDWQCLLLVIPLIALGDRLDVGGHGLVNAVNAWAGLAWLSPTLEMLTFMSHAHLGLHGLEIVGLACFGLSAHAFAGPLLEPTDPLVHVHDV